MLARATAGVDRRVARTASEQRISDAESLIVRLWREIYRKWAMDFQFFIEKPRDKCKWTVDKTVFNSQWISGDLR